MKLQIVDCYQTLSRQAAAIVAGLIRRKRQAVLGLATGGTPMGLYQELIRLHREEQLDFVDVTTFNLDEYVGLTPDDPNSYRSFMQQHLFSQINIRAERTYIPCGDASDLSLVCRRYEELIRQAGGIDLQILGIGANGHIGFNEPGADPGEGTRVVRLAAHTRQANARFFARPTEVPHQAVTMGIRTIMQNSRKILLLASGEAKAEALYRMVCGKVENGLPASYLQLHPNVTVLADRAAAKLLADVGQPLGC
ncbi:glucosamine-6-phosphate deaminase [Brevibacillus humidisoli]|uniref:glucosamine-6-phosphate deaminase n=1 Tax=Brevibacillus humidisoli TaxID=2895522 RepID=UPI001E2AA1BB|nr:glucosamine-6-phosphate deaminase [Brevibacillus humidisoli]UFJ39539.1 glucosamine-6-phosphate deaminase [Brevibacillus humidisoli]